MQLETLPMSVDNRVRPAAFESKCLYCGLNVWNRRRMKRHGCCTRNCKESLFVLKGIKEHYLSEELKTKHAKYGGSMYTTLKWLNLRHLVIERDNYMCRKCHSRKNLHVDHIVPVSWGRGGYWRMDNLQVLCSICNLEKGAKHSTRYEPIKLSLGR